MGSSVSLLVLFGPVLLELTSQTPDSPSLLPRMPAVAPRDYGYGTNRPGMAPPAGAGGYGGGESLFSPLDELLLISVQTGYPPAGGFGAAAAFGGAAAGGDANDRLQQALRVQQMLATLGGSAPPAAPPVGAPAPPAPYGAPPAPYAGQGGGYGATPPPPAALGGAGSPPHPSQQPALPHALVALLEKTRGSSGYSPQGASGGGTPPYASTATADPRAPPPAPPAAAAGGEAAPAVADPAKVQQLLAMLVSVES